MELSTKVGGPDDEHAPAVSLEDAEEEEEAAELSVESVLEDLGKIDYKVRLLFTTTHHQTLVSKDERKAMLKDVEKYRGFAVEMEEVDPEGSEAIVALVEKILAVIAGNEFLEDGKKKSMQACLSHGDAAGWAELADEPWKAQFVAKAAKCSYSKAVAAVEQEQDLARAIEVAPTMPDARWSTVPEGWEAPKKP